MAHTKITTRNITDDAVTSAKLDNNITITTADNSSQLILSSTDTDSSSGPVLELFRNSSSPADNDATGLIYFYGENDNDEKIAYSQIYTQIKDASDGTEDGSMAFYTMAGGTSTETLTLVSGKVGIGTASPSVPLHVAGEAYVDSYLSLRTTDDQANRWLLYSHTNDSLEFNYNGSGNAEVVIDTSGKVGIGDTAPDNKLQISDSSVGTDATANDSNYIKLTNKDAGTVSEVWGLGFSTESSGTDYLGAYVHALGNYSSNFNTSLVFGTRPTSSGAAAERMRIDSLGNVGIGVVPETWHADWEVLQIGEKAAFYSQASGTTGIGENVYYDSGWKAIATAAGSLYQQDSGAHRFYTMASVSADATSSPSEKFTIANDGSITTASTVSIEGVSNYTGLMVKGSGASRPSVKFSNVTQGQLAQIYGTEGQALVIGTGTSSVTGIQVDSSQRVTMPGQPCFSAALPAVTTTDNIIIFGGEHLDVGGHYNTSNGRFTAPVSGNYYFSFWVLVDPDGAGYYSRILFAKNGSTSTQWTDNLESTDAGATAAYHSVGGGAIIPLSANDYVQLYNAGQNPTYGTAYGNFSGFLVS